ncbi:Putative zinc ribbon domain protein [Clostridium formicaceticum]|uniref:Zinc ribbon domain protein n=1 Tax=Clostridium formicaceticum TaxID=1497 RepID=A0AAC9RN06_9CLOT|nr:Putative zinc ribbon domain protein [Clostridium formicaceticum]
MEEKYCQSCAMPMGDTDEMNGTNSDGTKNEDYCKYYYMDGAFTSDISMEEMI